jgi:hypothetical protein
MRIVFAVIFCGFDQPSLKHISLSLSQRVLNDLYRTKLPHSNMIWLLAHPLHPSPGSKLDGGDTQKTGRKRDTFIAGGEEDGVGEEPNNSIAQEPGPL